MQEQSSGLSLCRAFHQNVLAPAIATYPAPIAHSAALIGCGSEVLGFDDATSRDHDFFARSYIFIDDVTHARHGESLRAHIDARLPARFGGLPTRAERDDDQRGRWLTTLPAFIGEHLRVGPAGPTSFEAWCVLPQQRLLELTSGAVFHDPDGALAALRQRLAFYPDPVWRFALAAGWARIGQEEHLMGRTVMVGDALGCSIIKARLARDAMSLCFLMERRYAPYPKWFGTAFARLELAAQLKPLIDALIAAPPQAAMAAWCEVGEALVEAHNALELTARLEARATPFYTRPFSTIHGERVAEALREGLEPELRALPCVGVFDQWSDNTDLRESGQSRAIIGGIYRGPSSGAT